MSQTNNFIKKYLNYILFGICVFIVGLIYSIFRITESSEKDKTFVEFLSTLGPNKLSEIVTNALQNSKLKLNYLKVGNTELTGDNIKFNGDYGQILDKDGNVTLKFTNATDPPRIESWKNFVIGWKGKNSIQMDGEAGTIDITNPGGHVDIKGVGGVWGSYDGRKGITLRSADNVAAEGDKTEYNVQRK